VKRLLEWLLRGMTVCTIVIFFLAILTDTSYKPEKNLKEVALVEAKQMENGDWYYTIDTEAINDDEDSLCFYTNHQRVQVYYGEKVIYERMEKGDVWGETLGCMWNFVPIPRYANQLTVRVEAVYEDLESYEITFYHGEEFAMVQTLIRESAPMAIISALIVLIGLALVTVWFILRKKASIGESMLYLGFVAVCLGGWCFNETDFAVLTIQARMASAFMAYMFLMVLPPAFVLFIREFLKMGNQRTGRILTGVMIIEYAAVLGMHFLGIRDARENLFIVHVVLGIGVVYVMGTLVQRVIAREVDHRTKLSVIGFGVLTVAVIMDISSYYTNLGDMFYFTGIAFLFFILLMGWETAGSAMAMLKKGALANEYEKMAMVDVLTGLYNRNAYEKSIVRFNKKDRVMIVTFDINNLKMCNDVLGHRFGDKYIVDVANYIEDMFERYGKSYRIGGDEFCCIVENAARCPIEKLIAKIEKQSWVYKNGEKVFVGSVACGYAKKSDDIAKTLEEIRERADEVMYRQKNEMKGMQNKA